MFILLISNHSVFSFNLELISTCEFFLKSGECNFSVFKNSLVQINSQLNSKPYDHLYKGHEIYHVINIINLTSHKQRLFVKTKHITLVTYFRSVLIILSKKKSHQNKRWRDKTMNQRWNSNYKSINGNRCRNSLSRQNIMLKNLPF